MNLNIIQLKNYTEDLAPSITKNCETLIEQTHRQAEETLEFEVKNQEKHFLSIHQFKVKAIECLEFKV